MLARLLTLLTVLALSCASTPTHAITQAPGANPVAEIALSSENARRGFFAPEVKGNKEKLPLSAECTKEKSFAGVESSNCRRNYLRARYYEPGSGRFLGMDAFGGLQNEPASLHKYLYVHANPISNTDPSGHITLGQVMTAINISVTLISVAETAVDVLGAVANGDDISAKAVAVAFITAVAGGALLKAASRACKGSRCKYLAGYIEAETKVRLHVRRIPNRRIKGGENRVFVISGAFDVKRGRGTSATNGPPVHVTSAMRAHYAKFGAIVGACGPFDKTTVGRCAEQRAANSLMASGSRLKNIRWTTAHFVNPGADGYGELGGWAKYCGNCQGLLGLSN